MSNTTALLPEFQDNEAGWGPSGEPSFFQNVPYAPFSKSDKLGKAADWTNTGRQYQARTQQAVTTAFNVFEEEDEEDFQMVDTKPAYAQKKGFNKFYNKNQGNRRGRGGFNQRGGYNQRGRFQVNRNFSTYRRTNTMNMMMNKNIASIEIRPEWGDPVKEIDFMTLTKQQSALATLPESVEDLTSAGVLEPLNKNYRVIGPKNERPLEKNWFAERTFFKVTTSDDPILRQYIDAPGAQNVTVIATDAILAALMTVTRSVYSWDLVITKTADNKLIIDKRDDSKFDFVTVNENSNDPPSDSDELSNTPASLSQEATIINHNFSQQVLDKSAQGTSHKFDKPNPFVTPGDSTPVASAGYRYRKWKLGDITLIARTEVDCYLPGENDAQPNLVNVRCLLEYDPRVTGDWRRRYETQRGAVFATEIKNNSHRLARVVAQSYLAGVQNVLLGFIARYNPRDPHAHGVVGVQSYGPLDLAGQMVLPVNQLFGSLRYLVNQFSQLEPGKYLAIKDPNKPIFKVFQVPADSFQSGDVGMVTLASK